MIAARIIAGIAAAAAFAWIAFIIATFPARSQNLPPVLSMIALFLAVGLMELVVSILLAFATGG